MGMWDFANNHPYAFVFSCFAFGGIVHSFLNGFFRGLRK